MAKKWLVFSVDENKAFNDLSNIIFDHIDNKLGGYLIVNRQTPQPIINKLKNIFER